MFLIKLSVDRPVLTTMLILAIVVLGIFSYTKLNQDLTPKVDFPFVVVTAIYPGAGPKEVESQVTKYLEDEIGSVAGMRTMESQSLENLSLILCEFELEVDGDDAAVEVKDKVDLAMINLPRELEPPVVQQYSFDSAPVLNVAINSDRPLKEITLLADTRIKDEISKINGVSKVEIVGGLEREILIACNIDKLRSYGLAITDVVGYIQAENLNFPSGSIVSGRSEYALRLTGEFENIEQIRTMKIMTPTGSIVRIKDIATIEDTFEKPQQQARFQGKPAVSLKVMKKTDANTVVVSRRVQNTIKKMEGWFAQQKLEATIANDRAKYIKESIGDVLTNIMIGIMLTAILLYMFLHDYRSTIIVAVGMPSSIIATFSLMYFAGFTINIISLMALGISIGVLVTNSIVVLENISNKIDAGKDSRTAAIEGTSEVAIAVFASTLTNIVVFSPIAFMKGIIGRFFYQFGLTVVFATMISLLISFTLTPMLARLVMSRPKVKLRKSDKPSVLEKFANRWDNFYNDLAADYTRLLKYVLSHRALTAGVALLAFVAGIFILSNVGSEFFPEGDEGIIRIEAKLPPGTSLQQTDRTLKLIEQKIANVPEIKTVLAEIGGTGKGINEGQVTINMVDIEQRERSTKEIMDAIRPELAFIPAAEINLVTGSNEGPGSGLQVEITGPELSTINKIAQDIIGLASTIPGVIDLRSTYEAGKPELTFIPDRNQLANYGLTSYQLGAALRIAFEGQEVTYFRERGEDFDIRVQLAQKERVDLESFGDMLIRADQNYIPLSQLGIVEFSQSETKIERKNKQRVVKVLGNISGTTTGEANEALESILKSKYTVPSGYDVNFGGEIEFMKREFGYIFQALFLAIMLTYMVLAALLEDFVHPFTIMLTLPLGLIGVAIALFIGGVSINMMSLMAIVMLVGIVVNNAILILDYAKQLRVKGMDKIQALVKAASTRLRPIIMTNLAIAISVAPQAVSGAGAEYRRALAVVTMGGVLISAIFTLVLIPAIYTALDRFAIKPKVETTKEYES